MEIWVAKGANCWGVWLNDGLTVGWIMLRSFKTLDEALGYANALTNLEVQMGLLAWGAS